MQNDVERPLDFVLVNQKKLRITALSVLILTIAYLFTGYWILPAFLVVDFLLRSFSLKDYSLLNIISINVANVLSLETEPVDLAPKRFASKIGLVFSIIILILDLVNFTTAAIAFTSVLSLLAFLESVVGFCAGGYIYSRYKNIRNTKRSVKK